jgi:hypothetical protein
MDRYYFKKELTKRQHVSNSFCRYDDRLVLGGRGACCQLLMDDSGSRRIRYQLHHHWQKKLIYVLKRRQQIVNHYSKTIHIQQHKYTELSVVKIDATRVCFVYNCTVPLTTTRQYRSETLWITETSRTHRGTRSKNLERKDTCPSLPLSLSLSLSISGS